jgi:hypothetical protein
MAGEWLVFLGLMATMCAGVFIIVTGIRHRAQSLEMAHRERMAMIEKGIVPSPEANPGHAAWMGPHSMGRSPQGSPAVAAATRSLTLGIVVVAVGLGFMSIIGVAAETPTVALGIGGAIVIVGAAFIVIGQVRRANAGQSFSPPPLPTSRPQASSDRPADPSL